MKGRGLPLLLAEYRTRSALYEEGSRENVAAGNGEMEECVTVAISDIKIAPVGDEGIGYALVLVD